MRLLKQGAEAKLYEGIFHSKAVIVKERFTKKYRHPDLDKRLTKERMRAELKGLIRCKNIGIRTPTIYFVDDATNSIYLEKIENVETVNVFIGRVLKASTEAGAPDQSLTALAQEIGATVGKMHMAGIIHGDLTTSNILIDTPAPDEVKKPPQITLIDFGLSHFDNSAEDKGVDLYVLERALKSTYSNIPWFFDTILESYKPANAKDGPEVLVKLDEIRLRGRKRTMVG